MNLASDGRRPERRSGALVTPNTFALLGQPPLLGRVLRPDDATRGAVPVVLLGYDLWRTRFDADSGIVDLRPALRALAVQPMTTLRVD